MSCAEHESAADSNGGWGNYYGDNYGYYGGNSGYYGGGGYPSEPAFLKLATYLGQTSCIS